MAKNRRGKIARLPFAIREELNRRLLENEPTKKILAWLNPLPETIAVCDEFGEQPIDDRNVSDWRHGGFADWLRRRETVAETREMAKWSIDLAKAAGGNISEGASAILAGQILEVLEGVAKAKQELGEDADAEKMEALAKSITELSKALANVRRGDHSAQKLQLTKKIIGQADDRLQLDRDKFERLVCGNLLDAAKRAKAEEIANSNIPYEDKINAVRKIAFADVDALEKSGEVKIPEQ